MARLHFDIRDIFRAIRFGWSGKKIWVGLCGIALGYAGYSVLLVLAHLFSGGSVGEVWDEYGLFPGAVWGELSGPGTALHVLAMLFVLMVAFLSTCMICKITFQQLRGDDFYSSGDAWKFLKDNWGGVLFGPVAVLALFVFFLIVGVVIGWLAGLIPVLGEVGFALAFLPIFFAALVAVFISLAFLVSLVMSPAIVGSVGEDTLEVVIQSFSLLWSQPWRLILYAIWMEICVWIGVTVLSSLMVSALWLISWACGLFMGEKLSNMLFVARYYVPFDFVGWETDFMANLPAPGDISGSEMWAGRLLALMLVVLMGILLAYAQSVYASGVSLIYVILRKRKDDENLLEWEDELMDEDLSESETDADTKGEHEDGSEPESEGTPGADAEGGPAAPR